MGIEKTADAPLVKVGETVRLSAKGDNQGLQGQALSDKGIVVYIAGNLIRVKRDGIKTAKVYHASMWEKIPEATDLSEMVAAMKGDASDWVRRLVFADRLEEDGDVFLAPAWRWMGKNQKRPEFRENKGLSRRWSWYSEKACRMASEVSGPEYARLPGQFMISERGWLPDCQRFTTEDEAIEYLAKGLKKLRDLLA